jgi:two-component system nitrogen regulation response regulator NtrX
VPLPAAVTDPALESVLAAATLAQFQEQAERAYLVRQLQRHGWNVAATARAIQTPRSNLYKKIEAYGLKREE